jgi:hypothetical protein
VPEGIDRDHFNLLKYTNDSLTDRPFRFYVCRAELEVEWLDRKGCPWNDPIYASMASHDWEEKRRSSSITSWHLLTGERVFEKLETSLDFFTAVLNPNSSARRFWERPDQCDEAWGEPDESDHEVRALACLFTPPAAVSRPAFRLATRSSRGRSTTTAGSWRSGRASASSTCCCSGTTGRRSTCSSTR